MLFQQPGAWLFKELRSMALWELQFSDHQGFHIVSLGVSGAMLREGPLFCLRCACPCSGAQAMLLSQRKAAGPVEWVIGTLFHVLHWPG